MLQFSKYGGHIPELSKLFLIIEKSSLQSESGIQRAVEQVTNWVESLTRESPNSDEFLRRGLAILARLYFWSDLKKQDDLNIFKKNTEFLKNITDTFTIQEMIHGLGLTNAVDFFDTSIHELNIHKSNASNIRFSNYLNGEDFILYTPALSGFYSILENIVNASVFAEGHNKKLIINDNQQWWPYPIPFREIFGGVFLTYNLFTKLYPNRKYSQFDINSMRPGFSALCKLDSRFVHDLKIDLYSTIYSTLLKLSEINPNTLKKLENTGLFYIRGGGQINI